MIFALYCAAHSLAHWCAAHADVLVPALLIAGTLVGPPEMPR